MAKNKKLFFIIFIISIIISSSIVFGANNEENITSIVITTPSSSGTIFGNFTLNATAVGGTDNSTLYNITYEGYSTSTANSSYVTLCQLRLVNISEEVNKSHALACAFNNSLHTSNMPNAGTRAVFNVEDANTWVIRANFTEANDTSNNVVSSTKTSITIDYTKPSKPRSIRPVSNSKYDHDSLNVEINATVDDVNTTGCYIKWLRGSPTGNLKDTMTYSATTCTLSLTRVPDGNYEYEIYAFDGTNSTTSGNFFLMFDNAQASPMLRREALKEVNELSQSDLEEYEKLQQSKNNTSKNIAILVILLLIGYVIVNRNK